MFATVFFAIIDVPTGEMHYVNCGHEPPFLIAAGGEITRLKPTGPAVGTFPGVVFQCRSARIGSGDLLFACTDGVVETPDASGQPYAVSRLQDIIRAPHPSLNAMLTTIESALSRWHGPQEKQFDDITMLALKRSEMDGAS
jgi:sigma-B regulation protein RsbU (phosphoserine phosphatase)